MSVNKVDKTTGDTSLLAGSTLYADSPIGTILPYGGASAPSGWFLCQGQAISRANYSELFAIIGTSFGVGDGSTTFNIPDMREVVPVGAGTSNRSAITDHDDYSLGQFKDDQLQEHSHYAVTGSSTAGTEDWTQFATSHVESATGARVRGVFTDGRKGTTTHGKQLGVNYIIKAKMVAVPADLEAGLFNMLVPDYANPISGTSGQSWTATEDCYVIYNRFAPDTKWRLYLDEHIVTSQDTAGSSYTFVFSGYVKKGSVLRTESGATLGNMRAYPLL